MYHTFREVLTVITEIAVIAFVIWIIVGETLDRKEKEKLKKEMAAHKPIVLQTPPPEKPAEVHNHFTFHAVPMEAKGLAEAIIEEERPVVAPREKVVARPVKKAAAPRKRTPVKKTATSTRVIDAGDPLPPQIDTPAAADDGIREY